MMTKPQSYRRFFWKFGLFMPFYTALLVALTLLIIYSDFSTVTLVFYIALILWLIGLPASFCIALLVSLFRWKRNNHKEVILTALLGFVITLIYEFIVMWVVGSIIKQVGSFLHIEVLYIAWVAAVASYISATLWLPKDDFQTA